MKGRGKPAAPRLGWLVLPAPLLALLWRFPRHSWRPSGLADGVGPVTQRRYWLDLSGTTRSARETGELLLQTLPGLAPPALAHFRRLRPGQGDTEVGDLFSILMIGLRRGRVRVAQRWENGFRLQTLRQHPESGWTEFRVLPLPTSQGEDGQRLEIRSLMRARSRLDRLAYLLGVSTLQRLTWESTLRRAQQVSGGRKTGQGQRTQEWPYAAFLQGAGSEETDDASVQGR
ncbi:MAG: DUF1990 family protein [Deinococcus sp.]